MPIQRRRLLHLSFPTTVGLNTLSASQRASPALSLLHILEQLPPENKTLFYLSVHFKVKVGRITRRLFATDKEEPMRDNLTLKRL